MGIKIVTSKSLSAHYLLGGIYHEIFESHGY